jgi:hypothetical protein
MPPEKITHLQLSNKFPNISNTFYRRCTVTKILNIMAPSALQQPRYCRDLKHRGTYTDLLRKQYFIVYLISRMGSIISNRYNSSSSKRMVALQVLRQGIRLHLYLILGKKFEFKYLWRNRTYNNHNKGGGQTSKGSGGAYLPASSSQNNKSIFRKHAQLLNGMGIQLENIAEVVIPTTSQHSKLLNGFGASGYGALNSSNIYDGS